jgi:nitrate reductase alpha subunit
MGLTRRKFLKLSGAALASAAVLGKEGLAQMQMLGFCGEIGFNPLASYPDRTWESVYLNIYAYDSSFTYVCAPNDTHNCRVRAFVKNGVIIRVEQNYDGGKIGDLFGNKATVHWNPRMCLKGYTFHRRVYGPYRLKNPLIRSGWKAWADAGFPELTSSLKTTYKFDNRGNDTFTQVTWDQAYTYAAKAMIKIATRYSGTAGATLLKNQGYAQEMIDVMGGAGTRTFKLRGGMGLLGVIGKYGMYRFSNMLALLDAKVRGVTETDAKGGRNWSNYTWHGDQAPGHPFVHGLQASDIDLNGLRKSKLAVMMGTNIIENKMPEAHFFTEIMERGGKLVVVCPEYSPTSTKADYWIPVRTNTDTALLLGVSKIIIDNKWYNTSYMKQFTDFPLLVRTDTLKRLKPQDIISGYVNQNISTGPSYTIQGLTQAQRDAIGDFVVWDTKTNSAKAITRDDVGTKLTSKGIDPALEGTYTVTLTNGTKVPVMTTLEMYKVHLADYTLTNVAEITKAPSSLIQQLAQDLATIKPASIHIGEGQNHWFHGTEMNRACYLPLMLTGNVGTIGSGSHTWAGNYKAALFQGSSWSGPGFKAWVAENPFSPDLNSATDGKSVPVKSFTKDEEPAYWNHGDTPLIVNTPKYGRKVFTGSTHMPSPTKVMWFNNVNLINNAKHAYDMIKNVDPNVELIMCADIQMTASAEYSDIVLPANCWAEFQSYEITGSCSNPFIQIWGKSGIKPLYNSKDDVMIVAEMAKALGTQLGDTRFSNYWTFALSGKPETYIQRLLDASSTTRKDATTKGYTVGDITSGKYGEPGVALFLFRTYPREPFYEQITDSVPFFTDCGRLAAYCDIKEAIDYGENFIVHREGTENTPYQPNVIVSSNPYIKPDDYGFTSSYILGGNRSADERTVANIKRPWSEVKTTVNPLWSSGYKFLIIAPKGRHRVHSQWGDVDWNLIWDSNFGDPYRIDKRTPGVGEHQLHINPQAAKDLGIKDGDYIYVDANALDRPYRGWKSTDAFYKVARLMLRAKYNPSYPYHTPMLRHASNIATERSVKAAESRTDGRALSADTGYQANFRYGSQQSLTRDWSMPMHQTDTLFHKTKVDMKYMFGGEADNHAVNTVPKEMIAKITKAEDGGLGGVGTWDPATTGYSPAGENTFMLKYIAGGLVTIQ